MRLESGSFVFKLSIVFTSPPLCLFLFIRGRILPSKVVQVGFASQCQLWLTDTEALIALCVQEMTKVGANDLTCLLVLFCEFILLAASLT